MRYAITATKRYRKDYKRLRKSEYDMQHLEEVIDRLTSGESVPAMYRDHALHGILQDTRECHVGPDWLLRYAKDEERIVLVLIATGDHRHVFGAE